MHEDRESQSLGGLVDGIKSAVAQHYAVDVAADLDTRQTESITNFGQVGAGTRGVLHRCRAQTAEAARCHGDQIGDGAVHVIAQQSACIDAHPVG